MFLTKQDFQKNVSRHDGKSKIVVKFHGVPIYTFCQDISFRESMMLAETMAFVVTVSTLSQKKDIWNR